MKFDTPVGISGRVLSRRGLTLVCPERLTRGQSTGPGIRGPGGFHAAWPARKVSVCRRIWIAFPAVEDRAITLGGKKSPH